MNWRTFQIGVMGGFTALGFWLGWPNETLTGAGAGLAMGFGLAFFITGTVVSWQNWRDRRAGRSLSAAASDPEILPPPDPRRLEP